MRVWSPEKRKSRLRTVSNAVAVLGGEKVAVAEVGENEGYGCRGRARPE